MLESTEAARRRKMRCGTDSQNDRLKSKLMRMVSNIADEKAYQAVLWAVGRLRHEGVDDLERRCSASWTNRS